MPLPNNLQSILDRLAEQTDSIVSDASKDVKSLEKRLFSAVSDFVSSLEKDKSGNLKPTKANIKKLASLDKVLNSSIVDDKYINQVKSFLKSLEESQSIIAEYFKKSEVGFENDDEFNKIVNDALLSPIENTLTEEGLSANVNNQIRQSVTNSVVGGYSSANAIEELSDLIIGNEKRQGLLSRHVDQVASDAANQYMATYYEVISADLGLEFYLYEGSKKDTTRQFCKERFGKFYHKQEVRSWASKDWSGKIPTTNPSNIFVYRGGYNCRHQLIPVSRAIVPEDVVQRAVDAGHISA